MEKDHINVVFIGHVDSGKSSLSGAILLECGMIDERSIEKLKENAKALGRESWWKSHITDTNVEEQEKGKTVDVARAHFETDHKRITILDAPGHKAYVPNMISGASQADVAILVISARKGEFEAGFDRGGQTREHVVLCRTLGVSQLIIVINKMDERGIDWRKERYFEIQKKLSRFLMKSGYSKGSCEWVPISAMTAENLKTPKVLDWYKGRTLFDVLDNLVVDRADTVTKDLRIPVLDSSKDAGKLKIIGKLESGTLNVTDTLIALPSEVEFKIASIDTEFDENLSGATSGDNITIVAKGLDENSIACGSVLIKKGESKSIIADEFIAQLKVVDLPEKRAVFSAGFSSIIHIHTAQEEIKCEKVINKIDAKTKIEEKVPFGRKGDLLTVKLKLSRPLPIEKFEEFAQLGRFTLRNEGKTTCIGKIMKIKPIQ